MLGYALPFLTVGLAYFLWRWSYFGHPLPNPFYKKSAGELHLGAVRKTFRNVALQGGPLLAVLAVGLLVRATRRASLLVLLPVVAFAALWVLVSDEPVEFIRYGYTILPVIVIGWVPVAQAFARTVWDRWTFPWALTFALGLVRRAEFDPFLPASAKGG